MTENDEHPIDMLRRHCAMYTYGSNASKAPWLGEVETDFISFAGMHLICTMFITTDDADDSGGVFHRVLDPLGQAPLLEDIDRILDLPVGTTTVRQYLRSKRNKLAVHGSLNWSSQPDDVQQVTTDDAALEQFDDAMWELDAAVRALHAKLSELLRACPEQAPQPDKPRP